MAQVRRELDDMLEPLRSDGGLTSLKTSRHAGVRCAHREAKGVSTGGATPPDQLPSSQHACIKYSGDGGHRPAT